MKRFFCVLFCLIFALTLVACGDPETPVSSTDSSTVASGTNTDSDTDIGSNEEEDLYDPPIENKFIAVDTQNHSVVVFDLDACKGDFENLKNDEIAVVWEWDADEDPKCKYQENPKLGGGISDAKYRYSDYYKKDVIVACSSGGWVGVIDYEARSLLWETDVGSGPHSVEMLPNGDVVVASSANEGHLRYIPLSAGANDPVHSIESISAHGVCWDPDAEMLVVLEDTGTYNCSITNMGTENGKLLRISGSGSLFFMDAGGHAFSPVFGEPGKYWASSGGSLWQYDAEDETITKSFSRNDILSRTAIKGIASFPNGTVVQISPETGWFSNKLRIITREKTSGKIESWKDVVTEIEFPHRAFYKVNVFTKHYK